MTRLRLILIAIGCIVGLPLGYVWGWWNRPPDIRDAPYYFLSPHGTVLSLYARDLREKKR